MQVRKAADHALVELLVVLDAEARIFFAESLQRRCELLLLALVRGLDRKAKHRHGKIEWFQVNLILVVRIVQHRVEMDFIDLRDGRDVARNRLFDFGVILAAQLEEMADLERLLAVVDEKLRVLLHRALIDAEHAELADERIVDDLEDVGDHMLLRIGYGIDRFGARAGALDELRRIAFLRIRHQLRREHQQLPDAGAGAPGREADRHEMAFAKALLERIVELLAGEARFAVVEIMAHHGLVDLDDLIDDVLVRVGDRREIGFAARLEEAVDDAGALVRGQIDRQALAAEFVAKRLDHAFEIDAVVIDLVDDEHAAEIALPRAVHEPARLVADAGHGVDDDRAGLDRRERGQRRAAEVRRSRRVDEVDVGAAEIDRCDRGAERVLAFPFQRIVVGHRGAALDRACRLDRAAGMQQGFEQCCFAGARLSCESDVANVVCAVGHVASSGSTKEGSMRRQMASAPPGP